MVYRRREERFGVGAKKRGWKQHVDRADVIQYRYTSTRIPIHTFGPTDDTHFIGIRTLTFEGSGASIINSDGQRDEAFEDFIQEYGSWGRI